MKSALAAKPGPQNPVSNTRGIDNASNDDAPLVPPPAPKTGFLPTGLSRAITIAALVACGTMFALSFMEDRYTMLASNNQENSIVFRLDKRSGTVSICTSANCRVLTESSQP